MIPVTHPLPLPSFPQVRSLPVVKDDEVRIVRGRKKDVSGKVTAVYRKKFVIHGA